MDAAAKASGSAIKCALLSLIPYVVGVMIAVGIDVMGNSVQYGAKTAVVIANDLHWVFAAAVVISRMVAFVNFYPAVVWKGKIMGPKAGNIRANMAIYKVRDSIGHSRKYTFSRDRSLPSLPLPPPPSSPPLPSPRKRDHQQHDHQQRDHQRDHHLPMHTESMQIIGDNAPHNAVVMEDEGEVGGYNRGNRSLAHMVENIPGFVAGLLMCGAVFPFPTFALACVFSVGRVLHQVTCIENTA
jgi:hypothetical protein